jgi:uncharacterized membrane protein YeiB
VRKKTKVPKQDSQNLLRWPIFFIGTKNISSTFLSRKIEFLHCVLFLFLFVVFLYVWFRFENNIFNRKKPYIGHWRSKHNILTWKHLFNLKRKVHKSLSVRAWRTCVAYVRFYIIMAVSYISTFYYIFRKRQKKQPQNNLVKSSDKNICL